MSDNCRGLLSRHDINKPIPAALTMLAAMAIINISDNFVARISDVLSLWQFHTMRSGMALPLILLLSLAGMGRFWSRRWVPVFARGLLLALSMFLYFWALGFMSIAEALAGLFTSPIWVLLINSVIMKQRIGPWRIMAVGMGFGGILMVLQPGGDSFQPAILMPLGGGMLYAVSSIATRSWCEGETAVSMLLANMLLLGLLGAVMTVVGVWLWSDGTDFMTRPPVNASLDIWGWTALQSVGAVMGVFLIIWAYQLDEPSYVAIFEYSIMVFAPFFAWLFYGQGLGVIQTVGILLIALSGVLIALRSR